MTKRISSMALPALLALLVGGCSSSGAPAATVLDTSTAPGTSTSTTTSTTTNGTSTAPGTSTTTTGTNVPGATPCGGAGAPPAAYDHVVWIWMENHSAQQVLGRAEAPYETALARGCGTASAYGSVGRPSLPNYIGATSGDTWGITDDAGPSSHPLTVDNIFRQVRATGRRAVSYMENMPVNCKLTSDGKYAVKHNPAAYYQGATDRVACQSDDVPLDTADDGAFQTLLANDALPAFSFVTPDMCHDTHDCPVSTGDRWLSGFLPFILSSATYRAGRTAVFVVWDEDSPMPFIAIAPTVPHGAVLSISVDHYALLRTTEEMLGIPTFLAHAAAAPSMRAAFGI